MKSHALAGVFLVVGVAAALGFTTMWSGNDAFKSFEPVAGAEAELDRLERRLDRIEAAMQRLTNEWTALQGPYAEALPSSGNAPATGRDDDVRAGAISAGRSVDRSGMFDRMMRMTETGSTLAFILENAGMSAARAAAIEKRADELLLEAMEREMQGGQPLTPLESHQARERYIGGKLRDEFGVSDYERYREAKGLLTEVPVVAVESGSGGERAGLLPNDAIVSYNGERVMEFAELEAFVSRAVPGSPVLIEIVREGEHMTLTAPAGPLGVVEPTANDLITLRVRRTVERSREGFRAAFGERQQAD